MAAWTDVDGTDIAMSTVGECTGDATPSGDCYTPYADRPETYVVPAVFAVIFVVGVIGNGTLVVIFLRHRSMRNIPNTYIFSLALADLLVILICVPLASLVYTIESWPWGPFMCAASEFSKDVSIGVSVFTLTALSAERYCAIVNPLRKLHAKPLTFITAFGIWLVAIVLATPDLLRSATAEVLLNNVTNHSIVMCTPFGLDDDPFTQTYTRWNVIGKAIVYYFLPLVLIGVLYALMARRLHLSAREMPGELVGPQSRVQARARRHVARMVVTFVIVFIVCFLPHHVFMLWFHLNPNSLDEYDDYWHILRIIGFCLSFLNSCINPVALYCVSGVFRQHFHHVLFCRRLALGNRAGFASTAAAQTTCVESNAFHSTIRRTNTGTGGASMAPGGRRAFCSGSGACPVVNRPPKPASSDNNNSGSMGPNVGGVPTNNAERTKTKDTSSPPSSLAECVERSTAAQHPAQAQCATDRKFWWRSQDESTTF